MKENKYPKALYWSLSAGRAHLDSCLYSDGDYHQQEILDLWLEWVWQRMDPTEYYMSKDDYRIEQSRYYSDKYYILLPDNSYCDEIRITLRSLARNEIISSFPN